MIEPILIHVSKWAGSSLLGNFLYEKVTEKCGTDKFIFLIRKARDEVIKDEDNLIMWNKLLEKEDWEKKELTDFDFDTICADFSGDDLTSCKKMLEDLKTEYVKQLYEHESEPSIKYLVEEINCLKDSQTIIKRLVYYFPKIGELFKVSPFITPEDFKKRGEVQWVMKYTFVGREEELMQLHDFLEHSREKSRVLIGEGGVGKTRLVIEFADEIASTDWTVYFINHTTDFRLPPMHDKLLLILDESSQYRNIDSLIDFVLNPPPHYVVKLLLLDRPIFRESIDNNLKKRNEKFLITEIERGDIPTFIEKNFEGIDTETIKKIEDSCGNSFIFAAYYAEYFLEKREIGTLRKVIETRIEKYLNDISMRLNRRIEDVKKTISLLSLIEPLDWVQDKQFLEGTIFLEDYAILEDLVNKISFDSGNIVILSENKCIIKPDPIADYLRLEFLKNIQKSDFYIKNLLLYMPYRISFNIYLILYFDSKIAFRIAEILKEIWIRLNIEKGKTLEYFVAIQLFTGLFYHYSFFDIGKMNIDTWIQNYKELSSIYDESEARKEFTSGLVNATGHYGKESQFPEMERCLQELRDLHERYEESAVREDIASGLYNAANIYGKAGQFPEMEKYLQELRDLHGTYEESAVREELAKGLVNAIFFYGKAGQFPEMEQCLQELRDLHERYKEFTVRERLASGLVNAATIYGEASQFPEMEKYLQELRDLHERYKEFTVKEEFAKGLVNAANNYGKESQFPEMEKYLQELRDLHGRYPKSAVRERLARGLYNAANNYGKESQFPEMERCLQELRDLHERYKESAVREDIAMGLVNAIFHYKKVSQFINMERCLQELRDLHGRYEESAVREDIAMGLYNAATIYGEAGQFTNMERCLQELRDLHERYKEFTVRERLASGLVNAATIYGEAGQFPEMEKCLQELRDLHERYEESAVREDIAMGLFNAIYYYGRMDHFPEMEQCLQELRDLHGTYEEPAIREKLSIGLVNATNNYGGAGQFTEMEQCLQELRDLHGTYEEPAIREKLSIGLVNATNNYGGAGQFTEMEQCLQELRDLHGTYEEPAIREELAKGLYNALNLYPLLIKEHFDYLVLLYNLRYNLPNDPKKQKNIKEIENLLINEIKTTIESNYHNNKQFLNQYILDIKKMIEDETKFVLLMNQVCDKIPPIFQKFIWDISKE